jgi:hypothetical protein
MDVGFCKEQKGLIKTMIIYRKTRIIRLLIYWDNQKFGQRWDIIWDRIIFSVFYKPGFATNSTLLKYIFQMNINGLKI